LPANTTTLASLKIAEMRAFSQIHFPSLQIQALFPKNA
jgi:hypothetical protein